MQAVAVILLAVLPLVSPIARPPAPDDRALLAIVDSLLRARRGDTALGLLPPAIDRARTANDALLLAELLTRQGAIRTWLNDAARAEAPLREALRLAETEADSVVACHALRWLAAALSTVGRTAESRDVCIRLRPLAHAIGAREDEAQAVMLIAYHDLLTGELDRAQVGYRESIEIFRGIGSTFWELWALTGLGRVFDARGDFVGARSCLLETLTRSRATQNPFSEGIALNNLGSLEYTVGDPAAAAAYWEQARVIDSASGATMSVITVIHNLALARVALGHLDAAAALLDTAYALADSLGLDDHRDVVLMQTAMLRLEQGQPAEAATLFRKIRDRPAVSMKTRAESTVGLAIALARLDSTGSARALLEGELETTGGRLPIDVRLDIEVTLGRLLTENGAPLDAIRRMRPLVGLTRRLGIAQQHLRVWTLGARAFQAAQQADSAAAWFNEAARLWEERRSVPADPEWRERFARDARWIAAGWAELHLSDVLRSAAGARQESARTAFDRLQRFKSRTLVERMQGPGPAIPSSPVPPTVCAVLQRAALAPGELFIDLVEGTDSVWLFAITRDSLRVARVAGGLEDFKRRTRLLRDLIAWPPASGDDDAGRAAARALGRRVFADIADLIDGHPTLVFCLDGPLHGIPLALLASPGTGDQTLAETHTVCRVPSAAVFVRVRASRMPSAALVGAPIERGRLSVAGSDGSAAGARGAAAPRGILAVLGARRPDGRRLPGAQAEVDMLARRYAGVERRDGASRADSGTTLLDGGQAVIHVAAHTAIFDQRPWLSGIYLGSDATRADPYLRAVAIARLRLPATLAVLSACESAGGEVLAGEGVLGLTTAFMSAGVPCILASLWPVDDAATARLMDAFYRHLARGDPAAQALRAAQVVVRREARWRHPFYWAGFVLIGDGQVGVTLERRASGEPLLLGILLIVAVATLAALLRRRRHFVVTRADSGTLTR